jgi:hypothetical protein
VDLVVKSLLRLERLHRDGDGLARTWVCGHKGEYEGYMGFQYTGQSKFSTSMGERLFSIATRPMLVVRTCKAFQKLSKQRICLLHKQ